MLSLSLTHKDAIACRLRDVSPLDIPWDIHKAQSVIVAQKFRDADRLRYSDRITDCANTLEFIFHPCRLRLLYWYPVQCEHKL